MRVSRVRCSTAPKSPLLFGFNTYTDQQTVAKQRQVGANITRLFVRWREVEPQRGAWSWRTSDRRYQQILAGGLRPLLVVSAPPCWAQVSCNLVFDGPPSPAEDPDWSTYVRTVTKRYPQAVAVEVWNEPNLASTFYPQVNPARYTQLLREAFTAVKSVDPSMPVISGGLAMDDGSGAAAAGFTSRTFLADVLADGGGRWMDGVAIHVYPTDVSSDGRKVWNPEAMSRWLGQVREVEAAAGVRDKPIWVTEMGVSTTTEHGYPAAATPAQQARDLVEMVQIARADPDVRAVIIDSLQDANPNVVEDLVSQITGPLINWDVFYSQLTEGLGVFTDKWSPKPAACAISRAWGGSLTC